MTETTVSDASGCRLSLVKFRGEPFPPFPVEAITKLDHFQFRDDDVIISAYPKAGTHWVWEIVRMLLQGTTDVPVIEKDEYMIEFHPDLTYFTHMPSPRILSTHVLYRHLPHLRSAKCKLLYIVRNPRDVAVSFYNHHRKLSQYYHYHGTFSDYLQLFLQGKVDYGSIFDYTREWEEALAANTNLQVLRLVYEDMKQNPEAEISRISRFLGKDHESSFLQSVCEKCAFDSMRKRKGDFDKDTDGQPIMYRKGEVGDWQNWMTEQQVKQMDDVCRQKLSGLPVTFTYTLPSTHTPDGDHHKTPGAVDNNSNTTEPNV